MLFESSGITPVSEATNLAKESLGVFKVCVLEDLMVLVYIPGALEFIRIFNTIFCIFLS